MTAKIQQLKQFLVWFWRVAKRYWKSQEKFKALGLLVTVIIFIILSENASALLNNYQGELTTFLTNKQVEQFQTVLLLFGVLLLGLLVSVIIRSFIQEKLALYWRKWLTHFP